MLAPSGPLAVAPTHIVWPVIIVEISFDCCCLTSSLNYLWDVHVFGYRLNEAKVTGYFIVIMIACWSVLLSIAIPCILRAVTVIIPAAQGWQSCCFKRTCVGCHRRQVRSDSVGHSRRLDFEHRKSDSRIKLMAANEHIKHGASTGNTSLATSAVTSSSTSIKLVDEIGTLNLVTWIIINYDVTFSIHSFKGNFVGA